MIEKISNKNAIWIKEGTRIRKTTPIMNQDGEAPIQPSIGRPICRTNWRAEERQIPETSTK